MSHIINIWERAVDGKWLIFFNSGMVSSQGKKKQSAHAVFALKTLSDSSLSVQNCDIAWRSLEWQKSDEGHVWGQHDSSTNNRWFSGESGTESAIGPESLLVCHDRRMKHVYSLVQTTALAPIVTDLTSHDSYTFCWILPLQTSKKLIWKTVGYKVVLSVLFDLRSHPCGVKPGHWRKGSGAAHLFEKSISEQHTQRMWISTGN